MATSAGGGTAAPGLARVPPSVVILCIALAVIVSALPMGYLLPAGILAAMFLVWSYRRPVVAISLIILSHFAILERTETITIPEVVFGVYMFGFLGWWFADRILIRRAPLCSHTADWLLLAYLLYGLLSIVPALVRGAGVLPWFREYQTIATLFLYFPLREVMGPGPKSNVVAGAVAVLISAIAVNNIVNYGLKAAAANYFWELLGARQAANAHFLFPAFVVASVLVVHLTQRWKRAAISVFCLLALTALMLTFARGFWFGAFIGIGAALLASPTGPRRRALRYGLVLAVVAVGGVYLTAGDFAGRLIESIGERFLSTGRSFGDLSLRSRFIESQAALGQILTSPLIGNGIGTEFTFYDILGNQTATTTYAHNGYLFLLMKVGIIGTAPLMAWFAVVGAAAWRVSRLGRADWNAAMIRGCLGVICGLLVITVTSNVFIERESLLVTALAGALIVSGISPYPDHRR